MATDIAVTSDLGFSARVYPSTVCYFSCTMDPTYSPLVQHPLSVCTVSTMAKHSGSYTYKFQTYDQVCHSTTGLSIQLPQIFKIEITESYLQYYQVVSIVALLSAL